MIFEIMFSLYSFFLSISPNKFHCFICVVRN
uniref:Uncharacterized protein n=1 Tax=Myoviridae sp. ctCo31 TaxID=2825053 RepID=A0A8S5UMW9_9CAUD|nr:MAG TPA: hypothetical protein [Myoviridae sp. ctCo31]